MESRTIHGKSKGLSFINGRLLFSLSILVLFVVSVLTKANDEQDSLKLTPIKAHFKLPNLFNFEQFKQLFNRSYNSPAEETARNKIFLAKAFDVFLSKIAYKYHRKSHYLALNHLSDLTANELDQMFMSDEFFPEIQTDLDETSERLNDDKVIDKNNNNLIDSQSLSEDEIRETLVEVAKNCPEEPLSREIVSELKLGENLSGNRIKRSLAHLSSKCKLTNAKHLSKALNKVRTAFGNHNQAIDDTADDTQVEKQKQDEIFVDHRTSKLGQCYSLPRNQRFCGSCWAFASISLIEWHYCMKTGERVSFSEQHLVDCGHLINSMWSTRLGGCRGGWPQYVDEFIKSYGLELSKNYPYQGKQNDCHSDKLKSSAANDAKIHVKKLKLKSISFSKLDNYLQRAPVLMSFHTPTDFDMYSGGVDDAESCRQDKHHAMLVVGSGRESGKEYWLIRNSYSTNWGILGHWKLNKAAAKRCFSYSNALVLKEMEI